MVATTSTYLVLSSQDLETAGICISWRRGESDLPSEIGSVLSLLSHLSKQVWVERVRAPIPLAVVVATAAMMLSADD